MCLVQKHKKTYTHKKNTPNRQKWKHYKKKTIA